jgi:hypothetical protein
LYMPPLDVWGWVLLHVSYVPIVSQF